MNLPDLEWGEKQNSCTVEAARWILSVILLDWSAIYSENRKGHVLTFTVSSERVLSESRTAV